jgi:hypothetical protein
MKARVNLALINRPFDGLKIRNRTAHDSDVIPQAKGVEIASSGLVPEDHGHICSELHESESKVGANKPAGTCHKYVPAAPLSG